MNQHVRHRGAGGRAAVAAAALGCVACAAAPIPAEAGLMIDLRAVALNAAATPDPKNVVVANLGDVVSIDVYAVVSGTNTLNDEAFKSISGAFRSGTGGVLGDLSTAPVAPFNSLGSQAGLQIDIDGDGDLDIGAAPNGGHFSTFFVAFAAAAEQFGAPLPGAAPAAEEFRIGTMTFTTRGGLDGPATFLNFIRRANADGSNNPGYSTWLEDTPQVLYSGLSPYTVSGVWIVPEPGTAALTALALLARRRRPNDDKHPA